MDTFSRPNNNSNSILPLHLLNTCNRTFHWYRNRISSSSNIYHIKCPTVTATLLHRHLSSSNSRRIFTRILVLVDMLLQDQ